jgi:Zn-dependent metalloprotease
LACIVPPDLLKQIILTGSDVERAGALDTLALDSTLRHVRAENAARQVESFAPGSVVSSAGSARRTIYDMKHSTTNFGPIARAEGQPPVSDGAVNEAYDGFGATYNFYWKVFQRDSIDGSGMPINGLVHYGTNYDNAFWDGSGHMMFGDGDGQLFLEFTKSLDVIGHELTHGVTQSTANLTYSGQSGALNESISDVFGSLVKQRGLGQSAQQADWLIGQGLFLPSVHGVALRSMKAPGTAYDDPRLGKDPQPATMAGYVVTTDDNGGVHLNSGIPNHAFYLAATGIGGHAWEGAGQVWYDVLTGGHIPATCDFATFAAATVSAAESRYAAGSAQARAVHDAWVQVGVLTGTGGAGPAGGGSGGSSGG